MSVRHPRDTKTLLLSQASMNLNKIKMARASINLLEGRKSIERARASVQESGMRAFSNFGIKGQQFRKVAENSNVKNDVESVIGSQSNEIWLHSVNQLFSQPGGQSAAPPTDTVSQVGSKMESRNPMPNAMSDGNLSDPADKITKSNSPIPKLMARRDTVPRAAIRNIKSQE